MNALRDTADTAAIAATLRAAGSVFAEEEAALLVAEASTRQQLERFIEERVAGVPLEHIVGWVEFRGLRVAVEPGVFVPRRRTEFLAELAAADAREGDVAVDLCCGSGAIGAVIAHEAPGADVYASDIDPVAVACARRNLPPERVFEGDLFDALPGALAGTIDVLVANAPYVPTGAVALMPREARLHEHLVSLDGGDDGLDVHRRVIQAAATWMAPGGVVLIEVSERQAPALAGLFEQAGIRPSVLHSEQWDATVVMGRVAGGVAGADGSCHGSPQRYRAS
ncbi:putative protein N(5)-glutamine methyltransferase [Ruicaihuangia caeni]|uniref:peptide chain release factor N(5)-glutamine methyltransferase n=1 Tax=Ruicaihuangia caeni TaxID=3042517 RepID=A0AAW6T4S5_9MICO|nr:putative protein N(5)-glutamine methyltransferase [Klugiella sp. YN-L-19]MDI2098444.1 putative protein N(5)-glutamine methyltransferase [Klugiella sp. YN-L-19]